MRVHWLQHAPEDDLGCIAPWLVARGHEVTRTAFHADEKLPSPMEFDALLIMGGAMNVDEERAHPWLVDEKKFLSTVLADTRRVLGICLGAQLIAEALGARVSRMREREIGWFDVQLTAQARELALLSDWPETSPMFHWHECQFELPRGAVPLASSAACEQQAFAFDDGRVLGLQFHPEVTSANVRAWLQGGEHEPGAQVQTRSHMRADLSRFARSNQQLLDLFDRWLRPDALIK